MRSQALAIALALFFTLPAAAAGFDHSDLDALLQKAVKGEKVDYAVVAKERSKLQAYLARVAKADAKKLAADEKLPFYVNAYNGYALESVLAHKLPASVLKVPGFFDKATHEVAGEALTLNELEEKKIRSSGDPRVHFVVNCASISCPRLWERAYTPKNWAESLEARTREYLSRPGEVAIDEKAKTITVVQLFEWYQKDWGSEADVRAFLAKYQPKQAAALKDPAFALKHREYDWGLNAK